MWGEVEVWGPGILTHSVNRKFCFTVAVVSLRSCRPIRAKWLLRRYKINDKKYKDGDRLSKNKCVC